MLPCVRRAHLVVAAFVGVAAVAATAARLFREPNCPAGGDSPVPVLVSSALIVKGTKGSTIVQRALFASTVVRCTERKGER